jgi:hypothetical protein
MPAPKMKMRRRGALPRHIMTTPTSKRAAMRPPNLIADRRYGVGQTSLVHAKPLLLTSRSLPSHIAASLAGFELISFTSASLTYLEGYQPSLWNRVRSKDQKDCN